MSNCRIRSAHYFSIVATKNLPIVKLSKSICLLFFYRRCPVPSLGLASTYGFSLPSIRNEYSNSPGTVPYQNVNNLKCLMQLEVSSGRRRMQFEKVVYRTSFCVAGFYIIYAAYASISVQGFSYQHHLPQATTAD